MRTLIPAPTLPFPTPQTLLQYARRFHFESVFTRGSCSRSFSLRQLVFQGSYGQVVSILFTEQYP
jgi:hypothetical protein